MYVLYHKKDTASVAPLAVLEELGLKYRLVTIDLAAGEHRQPDFLKINPRGQVPAIRLPDGLVMTEAAAICLFLAEQHGRTDLVPATDDPQRAPFLEALVYLTNTIQTMYRRYYYPERHSTDPGDVPRISEKAVADLLDCWRSVDSRLAAAGPFHLGERYSLADLYMAMLLTWFPDQGRLLDVCPAVARCHARVLDRPAFARALSL